MTACAGTRYAYFTLILANGVEYTMDLKPPKKVNGEPLRIRANMFVMIVDKKNN